MMFKWSGFPRVTIWKTIRHKAKLQGGVLKKFKSFLWLVVRVCQNETMDEKTQPVVPSSWEEGCGVVEKNNDITYYKLNI